MSYFVLFKKFSKIENILQTINIYVLLDILYNYQEMIVISFS